MNEVAATRRDLGGRVFVKLKDGKTELRCRGRTRTCSSRCRQASVGSIIRMPIRITVNGAPREFPAPLTFTQLLDELDLAGRRLAVERNGEIVPRSTFAERASRTATASKW
jgi:sulfur carrier protein